MYFGLTGPMGSGKGEIAKILKNKGFKYISLSDIIRDEGKKKYGETCTRGQLQDIGNKLRKKEGAGVLAKRIIKKIRSRQASVQPNSPMQETASNYVIDGIRNPAEIEELRKLPNFKLIAVSTDREICINRLLARARSDDKNARREDMEAMLDRELGKGEPEDGQQVMKCIDNADYNIINEGSLISLGKNLERILSGIE